MTQHASNLEFDTARLELLRRRVMVLVFTVAILLIALTGVAELTLLSSPRTSRVLALAPAVGGVAMILAGVLRLRTKRRQMSLKDLVRRTTMVVVAAIVIQIPAAHIVAAAMTQMLLRAGLTHAHIGVFAPLFISMLLLHSAASIVLPWSVWESARPVLVIVAIGLIATPFAPDPLPARFGGLLGMFMMGVPGMLICWLRFSRLRQIVDLRFLSTRYTEVQRELTYARRIHEKLFPAAINNGPVLFDFRYEPMREIGGDFVDVTRGEDGVLTIVLVDVTGHGIPAALAVNRLQGEIKRTLAQRQAQNLFDPSQAPAQIISSLNEYVILTLADESVYGTALALVIEPGKQRITWVNAGHPPAFLCRGDGSVALLDSTAMMLGVLPRDAFDATPQSCDFAAGDTLIAYTDGGIECRGAGDNQLGIDGLRRIVEDANRQRNQPPLDAIMSGIASFRTGAIEDDTLVLSARISDSPATSATRGAGVQGDRL